MEGWFSTPPIAASCGKARRLRFPKKRPTFSTSALSPSADKMCGSPGTGSVVWHSPDGGRNWNAERTGQRAPIERLYFGSEKTGWAVGAFGSILRTDDGGHSWRAQHGGERRAALLSLEPRGGEISFGLLARQSAELGYRSVVVLPFRSGEEGAATPRAEFDLRLHDAVTSAGGSQGSIGWRLPLDVPGLDRDTDKLIAEWMRRTEGRLRETFFGNLVCQIPHVATLGHHRR